VKQKIDSTLLEVTASKDEEEPADSLNGYAAFLGSDAGAVFAELQRPTKIIRRNLETPTMRSGFSS
jgi:hypothetical protein